MIVHRWGGFLWGRSDKLRIRNKSPVKLRLGSTHEINLYDSYFLISREKQSKGLGKYLFKSQVYFLPGTLVYVCNPRIWETESELLQGWCQFGVDRKPNQGYRQKPWHTRNGGKHTFSFRTIWLDLHGVHFYFPSFFFLFIFYDRLLLNKRPWCNLRMLNCLNEAKIKTGLGHVKQVALI